jgi:predicted PurR-regulated permease PerM
MEKNNLTNIFLFLITLFITGIILRLAQPVIISILISLLLAYVMDPPVALLKKMGVPLWLSVLITAFIFLGIFTVFGIIIYSSLLDFARKFPIYQIKLTAMLTETISKIQIYSDEVFKTDLLDELKRIPIASIVLSMAGSIINILLKFLVIFVYALLILYGKYRLTRKIMRSFAREKGKKIAIVLKHIDEGLRRYLGVKTLMSLLIGFCALIQYGSYSRSLWILFTLIIFQNLIGNLLEPRIVGYRLKVTLTVVFFALLFWGWLWGAPGVLLAVPMTTSIKIVMANIPALQSFSRMMEKAPKKEKTTANSV